jgi:hypothetical protein
MQATPTDDDMRAAIIRDAIRRAGLLKPETPTTSTAVQAPQPQVKKRKRGRKPASAECSVPAVSIGACEVNGEQQEIEQYFASDPTWTAEDVADEPLSAQEFAPSLEAQVASLRADLALAAEREKSALELIKTLRIQLHKAYRLIAIQQINSFSVDKESLACSSKQTKTLRS